MTTVAQLVVQDAVSRGVRHIFGIPGGGAGLSLVAAANQTGARYVMVSDEATAAMAAAAYGEAVGSPGVCFGIQGTGGGNMMGGVITSYLERQPVLAITDRYPDSLLGKVRLQDAHLAQVFAPVTKASLTLRPETARSTLQRAVGLACAERPGPVHLDFPLDTADTPVGESAAPAAATQPPPSMSGDLDAAVSALRNAGRVVVIVGSDARRAGAKEEVRRLIEGNRAAVLASFHARGLLPEDHPRHGTTLYGVFVPETCEMDFLSKADLVLLAGVDPVELHRPWPAEIAAVQVQTSPQLDEACPSAKIKLYGPLKQVLGTLAERTQSRAGFSEQEIQSIRTHAFARFAPASDDPLPPQTVLLQARQACPRQGIMVLDTGIHTAVNEHLWQVYDEQTYIGIGGSRTMGAAVPWAIGMALAHPDVPVLACCGDGGFLMRLPELEVVARLGLNITFLVFNDRQLGTIQARSIARKMDAPGMQYAPVEMAAVARAFGLHSATVERLADFGGALQRALAAGHGAVLDLRMNPTAYTRIFLQATGAAAQMKA